ncbi:glycosyltransferase involved in cell wall biosynthesis [Rhodoligotrophos appendicifer]|uniref:glycosyltransferase family 1 protein n=1 Tax=Rhodoligotrophos appendicifer TaxID=987056 RepID=UPI0011870253|nr:glycosyltransferase family 1 protein [Rhodoligotrophos appendicifer]
MLQISSGEYRKDGSTYKEEQTIICFSHLRWDFVYQRPQHLLSRASLGRRIYYIEEPIYEDGAAGRLELRHQPNGIIIAVPVLPIGIGEKEAIEEQRRFLDCLVSNRQNGFLIFWYYTPMALRFSAHVTPDLYVYDCMDELSAFRGAPKIMRDLESALLSLAHVVFTGGHSLYEAKKKSHHNIHAFPSSIDKEHFSKARSGTLPDPEDQRALPRPRIGFFGVIDERMDVDLVSAVADARPDWQIVMIGPVVKIDPALLPRRENLHWLGGKSYAELPAYISGWNAGFMPFARNEATRFISPTKTPEFLSAGLPLVSTAIADVVEPYGTSGLVEIAEDAAAMVTKVEMVMQRPMKPWLDRVDRRLKSMSWDGTWASMESLLKRALCRTDPHTTQKVRQVEGEQAHV